MSEFGINAILRGVVLIARDRGIPEDQIKSTIENFGGEQQIELYDRVDPPAGAAGAGGPAPSIAQAGGRRKRKTRRSKAKRSRRASKKRK
jgi:hypothetical protein